ncbi:hypothetical protein [Acidocella sp.]|uniref:hypothetical protein n=1 Tax=Acidocella sp. TaxID=50710 RepID=UPI0026353248|nr:hypothetical protein [Acidocella sp.]MDD2794376.1 hypothetical protein [Acidocella sp.]
MKAEFQTKMPFACVVALTRTANKCRDLMKGHIEKAFDRPTPYAINAARAVPATKQTMASAVLLREFGGKGTPAEYFLGPEVDGGPRRQKRSEKALASAQYLQPGGFLVPGKGAAMNQYGNQQSAEVVKILSVLRAFGERGYRANRTKGWAHKSEVGQIFAVRVGDNVNDLKPGVYRRTETGVVCLMRFVKKTPEYRVRLPFDALVQADAARIFPEELKIALYSFL